MKMQKFPNNCLKSSPNAKYFSFNSLVFVHFGKFIGLDDEKVAIHHVQITPNHCFYKFQSESSFVVVVVVVILLERLSLCPFHC